MDYSSQLKLGDRGGRSQREYDLDGMGGDEKGTASSGVLLPKPITQSNQEKNIRQLPNKEHSTKHETPHSCQGNQKQGKSEKLSQPKAT